jgi:hypothetical protein
MTIWSSLRPFLIFYGRLVQIVIIWNIFLVLVCLDQEKSGNPALYGCMTTRNWRLQSEININFLLEKEQKIKTTAWWLLCSFLTLTTNWVQVTKKTTKCFWAIPRQTLIIYNASQNNVIVPCLKNFKGTFFGFANLPRRFSRRLARKWFLSVSQRFLQNHRRPLPGKVSHEKPLCIRHSKLGRNGTESGLPDGLFSSKKSHFG